MKFFKSHLVWIIAFLVPTFFLFRALFSLDTLAWGDAPHFVARELTELLHEPNVWTSRGENFGGVDPRLWISPLLILYGLLGKIGLANEVIVRALFYFPGIILSGIGAWLFAKRHKLSHFASYIVSLFYVCNTYFLLLVDGGQVGIVLAYGLFPFAVLATLSSLEKRTRKSFFLALIVMQITIFADPRIAILAGLFSFLLYLMQELTLQSFVSKFLGSLKAVVLFSLSLIGVNMYWLFPLASITQTSGSLQVNTLELTSLLHSLFVFQPHWPGNQFGKVIQPFWYFAGIPLLVFANISSKKKATISFLLVFLLLAFFAKGNTPPLGSLYVFLTTKIPFGSAFRDSSKFFIPLILLSGLLIAHTTERVNKLWAKILVGVYLFVLLLPAWQGNLSFVLSGRMHDADVRPVNAVLSEDESFARSVWLPERHPLTYETNMHPALDGKALSDTRVFGAINAGSFDKLNFLHDSTASEWMKLLGIKYLVLSGDTRSVELDEEEALLWQDTNDLVATSSAFTKVETESTVPLYEVSDIKPHLISLSQAVGVVGPEPYDVTGIKAIQDTLFLYFEDGKLDPLALGGIDADALTIVFNGTSEDDFTLSFLQDYFMSPGEASASEWGMYGAHEYLLWKYQLLIRETPTKDFDYGKGIALSENKGEKLVFDVKVAEDADYILAIRGTSKPGDSSGVTYQIGSTTDIARFEREGQFSWYTKGIRLTKGKQTLTLTNNGGLNVVNTFALIPASEWNEAKSQTATFLTHFGITKMSDLKSFVDSSKGEDLTFEERNTNWYTITPSDGMYWQVVTDSYHPDWKLKRGVEYFDPVPGYSMVNAFYTDPKWTQMSIRFMGQDAFRKGLYYSILSLLGLVIIYLWGLDKKND